MSNHINPKSNVRVRQQMHCLTIYISLVRDSSEAAFICDRSCICWGCNYAIRYEFFRNSFHAVAFPCIPHSICVPVIIYGTICCFAFLAAVLFAGY